MKGNFVVFSSILVIVCRCVISVEHENFPVHQKVKSKPVPHPCLSDSECAIFSTNATCIGDICICTSLPPTPCQEPEEGENDAISGQYLSNKIGSKCDKNQDCNIANSMCSVFKTCLCKDNFVASSNNRKCLQKARLGDYCEDSRQCAVETSSASCQRNKCSCLDHMHEKNGLCYRSLKLGEPCQYNEECDHIAFSSCTMSVKPPSSDGSKQRQCTCRDDYVASNSNPSRCLAIAEELGDVCQEDVQCEAAFGTGANCVEGLCQCKDLYQFKGRIRKCVRDVLLNEICRNHSDCHQPGHEKSKLECILGVCKCKANHQELDGYCISNATGGSSRAVIALMSIFALITSFCIVFVPL